MQRKWAVRPDQGQMLSREALIGALVDGATMLDIAGGVLEVVVGRVPTDVPGEMVMTGAVICWKDRTDARVQAETPQTVVPAPRLTDEAREAVVREAPTPEHGQAEIARIEYDAAQQAVVDLSPEVDEADGFDYSRLDAEDIEEAPVAR